MGKNLSKWPFLEIFSLFQRLFVFFSKTAPTNFIKFPDCLGLLSDIGPIVGKIRIFPIIPAKMWKKWPIFAIFEARTYEIENEVRKIILFFETDITPSPINVPARWLLGPICPPRITFSLYFASKGTKMAFFYFWEVFCIFLKNGSYNF